VTNETRRDLGAWLPRLLHAAALPWTRDAKERIPEGVPAHGVPSQETTLSVLRSTLDAVILPGFESLGVPTRSAREWCARKLQMS